MATTSQQQNQVFERFEAYDFNNDATFQDGLKSIINNNQHKSEKEQQDAIQNARYFYFARFVQSFDYSQYKQWRAQRSLSTEGSSGEQGTNQEQGQEQMQIETSSSVNAETTPSGTSSSDPTYPKSFQEICELIAAGKPIPGIRQIPDNLAEGTPSESKLVPKLKPWEQKKAAAAAAAADTADSSTSASGATVESSSGLGSTTLDA
ncbi:MAG: hypothetical protein J3Q66DRAFT_359055 [Benniella sp.]|nr:MAG: hypothetical protein J3Q66DRAFT_359055 [Benniella sp.]